MKDAPQQHTCTVCGKVGPWTREWSWYGSELSAEMGALEKTCSDACKKKHVPSRELKAACRRAKAGAAAQGMPWDDDDMGWR